jgi:tRNA A-37 threonylcarbamoyl transferase component Bud32
MPGAGGKVVGGFELIEEVGRGAMGVVFKARQTALDRTVALKFLPQHLAQDEKKVERFLREARAAGKVSHANVVAVYDVGQAGGLYYIAMEFVDGTTAYKKLQALGPLPEAEVVSIGVQVAQALKAAHAAGVLHRDVKPDNFLLDLTGHVRLADLGLARIMRGDEESHLTQEGAAIGSPHYMSPEAARGEKVDIRSDLYSLGASLYLLATGYTLFTGPTTAAILLKVVSERPQPVRELNPRLSPALATVIDKLVQKRPERRYPDAEHVIAALDQAVSGTSRHPLPGHVATEGQRAVKVRAGRTTGPVDSVRPRTRALARPRSQTGLYVGIGVSVLVVAGGGFFLAQRGGGERPAPNAAGAVDVATDSLGAKESVPPARAEGAAGAEAQKAYKTLAAGHAERLAANPAELAAAWEKFVKDYPLAPQGALAQERAGQARARAKMIAAEYQQAVQQADEALARMDLAAAGGALAAFAKKHPGVPEVALAEKKAAELREHFMASLKAEAGKARAEAERGDVDAVVARLLKLKAELPPEVSEQAGVPAALAAVERVKEDRGRAARDLAADLKRLDEAYQAAAGWVRDRDPRFQFAKAAQAFRTAGLGLVTDPGRSSAGAWAQRFERAGKCWDALRHAVLDGKKPELQALGQFNVPGRVSGWSENGLNYESPKLPAGGQVVPWRAVSAQNVMELAKALGGGRDGEPLDLGFLALAVGAYGDAVSLLDPEKLADAAQKALAQDAFQRAQMEGREELAARALATAKAAQERQDRAAAAQSLSRLVEGGLFAQTRFAQGHAAEIAALNTWAGQAPSSSSATAPATDAPATAAAGGAASTAAPRPSQPAVADAAGETSPEILAELQKAGWETVQGTWTAHPAVKGFYKVRNGKLTLNAADAAISFSFQLEKDAKCAVLVRCGGDRPIPPVVRDGSYPIAPGYGVVLNNIASQFYVSFASTTMLLTTKVGDYPAGTPIRKRGEWPMQEGGHELLVQVQGKSMNLDLDGHRLGIPDLNPGGSVMLVIEGSANVKIPQVKKL